MSGDVHVLHVGSSSLPTALREAHSDFSGELKLTHVEAVETAEAHLLGGLPFACVVLTDAPEPAAVERLRSIDTTVPIFVAASPERVADLTAALATVESCTVRSRTDAWAETLSTLVDERGESAGTMTDVLLRQLPAAPTVEDVLTAVVDAVTSNTPARHGQAWRQAPDEATFERIATSAGDATPVPVEDVPDAVADVPEAVSRAAGPVWLPLDPSETGAPPDASELPFDGPEVETPSSWALGVPVGDGADPLAVLVFVTDRKLEGLADRIDAGLDGLSTVLDLASRTQELERYETIMETVGDGVYVLDGDGRFVAVNDAYLSLTGYDRSALLGTDAADIVGTDRTDQAEAIQTELEDSDSVSTLRTTVPTADGETIPVEARISLFPMADGTTGRVGVVRDIRDRLGLEHELGEVLERVSDAFFALDTDWRFTYVNEQAARLIERDAETLRGNVVWEEFPAAVDSAFEREYRTAMERGESTTFVAYFDPLDTWFRVHAYPSETGLSVYFADVTEEKLRSQKLDAMTEAVQAFPEARTTAAVAESTVRTATDALAVPHAVVALYDGETGRLEPTATGGSGAQSLIERVLDDDTAWDAYVEGETRTVEGAGSAMVVPLESHGVLVAATTAEAGYGDVERNLLTILGAHAKSAMDRADREARLRERKNSLEEKHEALQRVNRLNGLIRQVTQVLTRAGSREALESSVCAELADTDPYRLAWFCRYDSRDDALVPTAGAGIDVADLDPVAIDAEGSVTARAAATGDVTVLENVHDRDPPYDSWARTALKRGCQSCLAVPVSYRGEVYGVLALCATGHGDLDDLEQTVLSELGETIGYAVNALERKRALVSERTVDLEFRTSSFGDPLLDLLVEESTALELETLVQRRDGLVHAFFDVADVSIDALEAAAEQSMAVESLTVIAERDSGLLVECSLSPDSILSTLLDRGAMVRSIGFTDGAVRLVIRIPQSAGVRRFIDRLEAHFGTVELVARRERDEPIRSVREFYAEFEDRLTDRQREVIETAYYGGFFEWPRESTGVEIAELLDVSQPTVNRHIRRGERTLFGMLFDEDD